MRHISIDGSSKRLGWVLAEDHRRVFSGTYVLDSCSPIERRIEQAYAFVVGLLATWEGTALVTTEAPAVTFAGSAIAQLRVNGGIILAVQHNKVLWSEVSVTEAKKALTGSGSAKKPEMLMAAAPHLGYLPERLTIAGSKTTIFRAMLDDKVVYLEDEADALGCMLASHWSDG